MRSEYINMAVIEPQKFNRIWGEDFFLLDSNNFMGGTDGSEYENVIEIFVKIRNSNYLKTIR